MPKIIISKRRKVTMTIEEAFNNLETAKSKFWNNHESRMNELNDAMNSLQKSTKENCAEIDELLKDTTKDLEDLLK